MAKIKVLSKEITIQTQHEEDYISLTDIARYKDAERTDYIIQNWLRNRNTIEFLGIWEHLNNPDFNPIEFDGIKKKAGLNSFILTAKRWIEATNAIGLISRTGRYGGTYAHKDIAFEFASWVSIEFKLYLIKEFQRLKEEELKQLGWDIRRNLAKINYRIHTDAIKENLIPPQLTPKQVNLVYAMEADVLNMALFGMTAKDWRDKNPDRKGNIRDDADVSQLVCLSNLENLNALLIQENVPQAERLRKLNHIAIHQMKLLANAPGIKQLEGKQHGEAHVIAGDKLSRKEYSKENE
ncbi:MAG: KilA-N domain-containing protein [bacterium]|nr:KilA-N domain-containing protein [bacterium]